MSISASEARRNLFPLIQMVNDDRVVVEISSNGGDAVLVAREEWEAIAETIYLTRSPANAERLLRGLQDVRDGRYSHRELASAPPSGAVEAS